VRGVSLFKGLAAVCAALALAASGGAHAVEEGGTFRVGLSGIFDFIDPALAYHGNSWALLDTSCATLMRYPDKPAPEGYRLATEVAQSAPRASKDLKTWTFTLRSGFRFSDGTPVEATAFARAIHRTLDPAIESPGAQYTQAIVGARDVLAGRATAASGVVARGNTLTVRFTKPVADFPAQTTMPFFCAVPPGLPVDPEGIGAFPGSGPYYVKEFRPGERLVIERNPYYRGSRPHHVDGFLVDLRPSTADQTLDAVEDGTFDWGFAGRNAPFNPARNLVGKYGVNRSQFFVAPSTVQRGWAMNTSRPLFRDNIPLRQAVNFALDRSAFSGGVRGRLTDQYQLPEMPGFQDARIYPLRRPDLPRAKSLARGNLRGGKANLYIIDVPELVMFARLAKKQLAAIGLDVRITAVPASAFNATITRRGTPWDILLDQLDAAYLDPSVYLEPMFAVPYFAGNFYWLDEPEVRRALRAASRLQGQARARAYGQLDVKLARDYAPMAAIDFANEPTLVSKRVGCVVVRPTLDLTAVCLK
jgi:ABC-type oligopeptide transport system substrate-binding subunit